MCECVCVCVWLVHIANKVLLLVNLDCQGKACQPYRYKQLF